MDKKSSLQRLSSFCAIVRLSKGTYLRQVGEMITLQLFKSDLSFHLCSWKNTCIGSEVLLDWTSGIGKWGKLWWRTEWSLYLESSLDFYKTHTIIILTCNSNSETCLLLHHLCLKFTMCTCQSYGLVAGESVQLQCNSLVVTGWGKLWWRTEWSLYLESSLDFYKTHTIIILTCNSNSETCLLLHHLCLKFTMCTCQSYGLVAGESVQLQCNSLVVTGHCWETEWFSFKAVLVKEKFLTIWCSMNLWWGGGGGAEAKQSSHTGVKENDEIVSRLFF